MTDYALPVTGTGTSQAASVDDHNAEVQRAIDEAVAAEAARATGVEAAHGARLDALEAPGNVSTADLADSAATNAKLAPMAEATIKGRAAGAGAGSPQDLTPSQARTAMGLGTAATTDANEYPTAAQFAALAQTAGGDAARPGTQIAAFGVGSAGAPSTLGDLATQAGVSVAPVAGLGEVLIVEDVELIVAPRTAHAVQPGRVYRLHAYVQRLVDPADPVGDTVRVALRRLDADYTALATLVVDDHALTVADGLRHVSATFALDPGLAGVDHLLPEGTVYIRPQVQFYGTDHRTAPVQLEIVDITEAAQIDGALDVLTIEQAVADAETAADRAELMVVDAAQVSADRAFAEAAAAAAATAAKFYDTIALGRAAVADGATFGVKAGGADGLSLPTLYRRDTSTTQTKIVDLVSGDIVYQKGSAVAAISEIMVTGSVTAGPTSPTGSSGTQINGSIGASNHVYWNAADVFTQDGVVDRITFNQRYNSASPTLLFLVLSSPGTSTPVVQRYVEVDVSDAAQYETVTLYAGTHFEAFTVEAGWGIGFQRSDAFPASPPTIVAETGSGLSYAAGVTSITEGQTINRTSVYANARIQMNARAMQVVDPALFEENSIQREANSIRRQEARLLQGLREKAARFEKTPLEKLARKVAGGLPATVLAMGTSIANNSNSTVQKFLQSLQRDFGPAMGISGNMGGIGGANSGSYNGWQRQDFGGPKFLRLHGTSTSTAFTLVYMGDKFRLWYSTETDGGEFTITVDGNTHTINCAGAQSYWNLFEIDLDEGGHVVTFNPPASGNAYLEWAECVYSASPGVLLRDATLGGSSLNNCRYRTNVSSTGNPTGAAIVGTNGLDAHLQDDADLAIISWHVNDAGTSGSWVSGGSYATDLSYLVDGFVSRNIPVIVFTELSGHYRNPANATNFANYITAKKAIQLQARKTNVWVLDWDEELRAAVYVDDVAHFLSSFYVPGGDEIHPHDAGYRPADDLMTRLTGVRVRHSSTNTRERNVAFSTLPDSQSGLTAVTVGGLSKLLLPKASGARMAAGGVWRVPLYIDPDAVNFEASFVAANIDASVNNDEYGKYYLGSEISPGAGVYARSIYCTTGTYWVAMLSSAATSSFRLQTANGKMLYDGDETDLRTGLIEAAFGGVNGDKPTWKICKFQITTAGNFEIRYGRLYDICRISAVGTDHPIVVR